MSNPTRTAHEDLTAHAQAIIDRISYLTLGTTDTHGRPWTSPVYYAAEGVREFYWESATDARHSRNITDRPQVSVVVFDSTVLPYHGRAVYAVGTAHEVSSGSDLDRALQIYPGPARAGTPLRRADVTAPEPYRLFRATASHVWVLCPREPRQACALHGLATDHRARVWPSDEPTGAEPGDRP
jgi:nitroimidazol reductase NimA-like FMN-containing flavoprotein (pyridoxamine 5'-phosphate oxidase superfamily)